MVPRRGKDIPALTTLKNKRNFFALTTAVYQCCDPFQTGVGSTSTSRHYIPTATKVNNTPDCQADWGR